MKKLVQLHFLITPGGPILYLVNFKNVVLSLYY